MLVFAFDRDRTVDANPHPHIDAVPLEWVRQLANGTPHAVYAIGNQTLCDEAAIPGAVDGVGRRLDGREQWSGGTEPDGRYEQGPLRRDRLSLVADLHLDADGYVVVDDPIDVDGWEHYHAWEFVRAVERGTVRPALQGVREPVTDGGRPAVARITPDEPSILSSFLDEHRDAPGFELTYTDDGIERTRLLHDVSLHAVTLERPAAAPAVQCTPIAPNADQFTVRIDAIELVAVVDPSPERYTEGAETPVEEARGLRRLADVDPTAVDIPPLLALLDRADEDPFRDREALGALRRVAAERPDDCTPAIPVLRSLLAREELVGRADALATLRAIGEADPGAIAQLGDELVPFLGSNGVSVRRESTRCLAAIAEAYPDDAVAAVPALATIVQDGADGQRHAMYALSRITRAYPAEVKPVAETLGEAVLDDSLSDATRLNATAALGRIVGEYPGVALDVVDDVATLFDAANPKLRNNAIGLIGEVALVHTDVVEPHTEEIAALLTVDDPYTRINASGALSRVAEVFPASVDHVTPTFVELLSDEHPLVRVNACWALGHLRAREATSCLEDRVRDDENADVRTRASWALARIEE